MELYLKIFITLVFSYNMNFITIALDHVPFNVMPVVNKRLTPADRLILNEPSKPLTYNGFWSQPDTAGMRTTGSTVLSPMIVGGTKATQSQFPWLVAILVGGKSFCGGSLITKNHVLTAAHCADKVKYFYLYMGVNKYLDVENRITFMSTTKYVHSLYNSKTLNNDIAIIKLMNSVSPSDISSGKINYVKLPSSNVKTCTTDYYVGKSVTVCGYGRTSDGGGVNPDLLFASLTVINSTDCATVYTTKVITASVICTSGDNGKNICNGDSGGPLMILNGSVYTQIGIVSFGSSGGCAEKKPAGFTLVCRHLEWIATYTGIKVSTA